MIKTLPITGCTLKPLADQKLVLRGSFVLGDGVTSCGA